MTLVLKSNNTLNDASLSLGDKHGINGPTDWILMLDFQNEDYVSKIENQIQTQNISDVLMCVRDTQANILTRDEQYSLININELRLSKSKSSFGLLIEPRAVNHFRNSSSPISKSITITPAGTAYLMCRVKGTGKISVTSADTIETQGQGTEESPLLIKLTKASGISTLNVVIEGALSYASMERTYAGFTNRSFTQTQNSLDFGRALEIITLNQTKIEELFGSTSNYTVVFQCDLNTIISETFYTALSQPLLEIGTTTKHYALNVYTADGQPPELRVRAFDNTEKSIAIMAGVKEKSTIAISVTPEGYRVAIDGKVSDLNTIVSDVLLSGLKIGSTIWTGLESRADGCFTKLTIYDRALTVSELMKVSQSF